MHAEPLGLRGAQVGTSGIKYIIEFSSGGDRSANLRNETVALEEIILKYLFNSLVGGVCVCV